MLTMNDYNCNAFVGTVEGSQVKPIYLFRLKVANVSVSRREAACIRKPLRFRTWREKTPSSALEGAPELNDSAFPAEWPTASAQECALTDSNCSGQDLVARHVPNN